jgi:hypothetical protein
VRKAAGPSETRPARHKVPRSGLRVVGGWGQRGTGHGCAGRTEDEARVAPPGLPRRPERLQARGLALERSPRRAGRLAPVRSTAPEAPSPGRGTRPWHVFPRDQRCLRESRQEKALDKSGHRVGPLPSILAGMLEEEMVTRREGDGMACASLLSLRCKSPTVPVCCPSPKPGSNWRMVSMPPSL